MRVRPKSFAKGAARHYVAGRRKQQFQNLKWFFLKTHAQSAFANFARFQIHFKRPELYHCGQASSF
jgi:hypothetical protein